MTVLLTYLFGGFLVGFISIVLVLVVDAKRFDRKILEMQKSRLVRGHTMKGREYYLNLSSGNNHE